MSHDTAAPTAAPTPRRPLPTRRALLAGLALLLAAAPSDANANPYGTQRSSPFQFAKWTPYLPKDVTITHHFGVYNETIYVGNLGPSRIVRGPFLIGNEIGQTRYGYGVTFYTGGSITATDYWTVTAWYDNDNAGGAGTGLFRSLDQYGLYPVDASVMFTIDMRYGSYSPPTGTDFKLDY